MTGPDRLRATAAEAPWKRTRDRRILRLRGAGLSFRAIAAAEDVTLGVVAGLIRRSRVCQWPSQGNGRGIGFTPELRA